MTEYPRLNKVSDMFSMPEFQTVGALYVARTGGWSEADADRYWVCEGGLVGRPHSGPFATAAEAEALIKKVSQ